MPRTMLVQSYRSDSTLVRSHVLSVCTKSLSIMGPQGSGKDSLFKDLSKQHTCGILYTGSRAKDNPHDISSYMSSCGLYLSLKPVPENLQFCYGYFSFLHSDARADPTDAGGVLHFDYTDFTCMYTPYPAFTLVLHRVILPCSLHAV
jgi:hypothetical protein